MDTPEQIAQLQRQLHELQQQVQLQQQQIAALQQQARIANTHTRPAIFRQTTATTPNTIPSRTQTQKRSFSLENFIGLSLMHLAGIIVLVIGLSLGVKYAIDKELISATARIILAYLTGAGLFVLSLFLKKSYNLFSAILFSGAMASLYFTTYGACDYYQLLPVGVSFGIMIAITIYTSFTALRYNRQEIGLLGMTGAYGIPFLISHNARAGFFFLAYILLINMGVAYLYYRRSWQLMNWIANLTTWILFIGWSLSGHYTIHNVAMAVSFLFTFYILFQVAALGTPSAGTTPAIKTDGILFLLNNIILYLTALILSKALAVPYRLDAAQLTFGFAVLYGALGWGIRLLYSQTPSRSESVWILAITLLILAIWLQWSDITATLLWLLLAIILFVIGLVKKIARLRMLSITLLGITLIKLLLFDNLHFSDLEKTIAYIVLGSLLLVVSFFYQKFKKALFPPDEEV